MPDAASGEHYTSGETSTQQANNVSSSEHGSSKSKDPPESSQHGDLGSRQQMKPGGGFQKKGKVYQVHGTIEQVRSTHLLTTDPISARRKCKNGGLMCLIVACMPCTCGMSAMWSDAME